MKTKVLAILCLLLLGNDAYCQIKVDSVGANSEYDKAEVVLMHEPSNELFLGVIHPKAALFEDYFRPNVAAEEHQAYQKLLKDNDIQVITVREVLLQGTLDEKSGELIEGEALDDLRSFTKKFYEVDLGSSSVGKLEEKIKRTREEQLYLADTIFNKLHPKELVDILLLQPEVTLRDTEINTGTVADYKMNPLMNFYFSRDQIITTAKGIVIGKLNSKQRQRETDIIKFCLKKLNIEPIADIGDIKGKGAFLEGGDFIPFGNTVFIGQGLRTTDKAIQYLMEEKVFGDQVRHVAVVKDKWLQQSQMHLDTYFNVIDKRLAVMDESRRKARLGNPKYLEVDVYSLVDETGKYEKNPRWTGARFVDYLGMRKVKIIDVSKEDVDNYGVNFLTIDARKIIVVKGISEEYKWSLNFNKVKIQEIDFTNMMRGWGAAHCTTQVIKRKKEE